MLRDLAAVVEQKQFVFGWHWPEEILQKMRLENQQTLRGKPLSPEMRDAIARLPPLQLEASPNPDQFDSATRRSERIIRLHFAQEALVFGIDGSCCFQSRHRVQSAGGEIGCSN
jgi:hypothetical protein